MKRLLDTGYYIEKSQRAALWIFFGLLAYMPLHILLSTWLGNMFGLLELAKVFKDVVLLAGFSLVIVASIRQPGFKLLLKDKLVWLIGAYALLTLGTALLRPTDQDAEILAIVYNLRFLVFFLYGTLLTLIYKPSWLQKNAVNVVLAVAGLVLAFGFVQYMWLPDDALARIGYGRDNGVLPAFFIDDKPDLERIMSTLRDPNSFGSYLIIVLSLIFSYLLVTKNKDLKNVYLGLLALGLLCLWFTFSRSAWIGAFAALLVLVALHYKRPKNITLDKRLVSLLAVGLVVVLAGLFVARDSYFIKNVILHADESTVLEDPNELRVRVWRQSIDAVADQPFGYGPGTAGLPSVRNDIQGTVLNENYYLQIMYEVGVLGLGLFLAILVVVGYRLYGLVGNSRLALALLASFIGLVITNFLVHIWANEAVAYTWWGLAGLAISLDSKKVRKIAA